MFYAKDIQQIQRRDSTNLYLMSLYPTKPIVLVLDMHLSKMTIALSKIYLRNDLLGVKQQSIIH